MCGFKQKVQFFGKIIQNVFARCDIQYICCVKNGQWCFVEYPPKLQMNHATQEPFFVPEKHHISLQMSCIFECQLAYTASRCGCIPWDYPQLDSSYPICHVSGRRCFESLLPMSDSVSTGEPCDCPNDCSGISYQYNIVMKDTDATEVCIPKLAATLGRTG